MSTNGNDPARFVEAIRRSGLSIYEPIEIGDSELWIPTPELEYLLSKAMAGVSLANLPLRTRSKVTKEHVCRVLGYPVPSSFKKTQPRFPGQNFDTYVQKSNNLQVWNEELSPNRRYVIFRVGESDVITRVKVVTGRRLELLDSTGTLTQKYQARLVPSDVSTELISNRDNGFSPKFRTRARSSGRGLEPGESSASWTFAADPGDLRAPDTTRRRKLPGHWLRPRTQSGCSAAPTCVPALGLCRLPRRRTISGCATPASRSQVANVADYRPWSRLSGQRQSPGYHKTQRSSDSALRCAVCAVLLRDRRPGHYSDTSIHLHRRNVFYKISTIQRQGVEQETTDTTSGGLLRPVATRTGSDK